MCACVSAWMRASVASTVIALTEFRNAHKGAILTYFYNWFSRVKVQQTIFFFKINKLELLPTPRNTNVAVTQP